jgi:hypothetical protein
MAINQRIKSYVMTLVDKELEKASENHPPFRSKHEGLAIIEEEFLELRKAVFIKYESPTQIRKEAIHTAAMAIRFLIDLDGKL